MAKLRVGLLIDQNNVPLWVCKMIQLIIESDHSEISLIIKNKSRPVHRSFHKRLYRSFRYLLFALYVRIDRKFFKLYPNAFENCDLSNLIGSVETIEVLPQSTALSDRFAADDLQIIQSHNLDVIIRIGFKILRGDILKAAKYGIWSFHHGDNRINRGGPAGVWEVLGNWSETGVILQILTEELDGGIVIESSFSKTDDISIARNNNNSYWKSLSMIPRNLKKLQNLGGEKFMSEIHSANKELYFYYNKLFVTPANSELALLILKKLFVKLSDKFRSFFFVNQWILMYHFSKSNKISTSFFRFKRIYPPKDRFWADPFIIFKDDLYYIFIEELIFKTNKGHIAVFTLDKKGNITKPERVLEKEFHLSYPFIFEENNEYYMIPETEANKTIELYKCVEFPNKWELVNTLMENVSAVDSTIYFHDNKYWLFCNIKENEGASNLDELFIFYADHFNTKDWIPHEQNPVVSNVKKARPAGNLFTYNGELYRPGQDCSKHYGRGMHLGKIRKLTEKEYVEESIQFIYPVWDKHLKGMHTLNYNNNLTITDGQIRRLKF